MLKPKRKITKKEIKRDPLLETVYKGQKLFEEKQKFISICAITLISVFAVFFLFRSIKNNKNIEANKIMSTAMSFYQIDNFSEALSDFDDLISNFANTTEGENALFYSAKIHMNAGRNNEARKFAQDYLKSGNSSSHILGSILILAEINENEGKYFDAATNYLQASEISNYDIMKNRMLINAISCFILNQDLDQASIIISDLENKISSNDPLDKDFTRIKSKFQILSNR